jgi:hypothetical protein
VLLALTGSIAIAPADTLIGQCLSMLQVLSRLPGEVSTFVFALAFAFTFLCLFLGLEVGLRHVVSRQLNSFGFFVNLTHILFEKNHAQPLLVIHGQVALLVFELGLLAKLLVIVTELVLVSIVFRHVISHPERLAVSPSSAPIVDIISHQLA